MKTQVLYNEKSRPGLVIVRPSFHDLERAATQTHRAPNEVIWFTVTFPPDRFKHVVKIPRGRRDPFLFLEDGGNQLDVSGLAKRNPF